jgi:two-component system chemotaxis response regulator CheY
MRILIAEDDVASGLLLRTLLEPYGICTVVTNGKEAVEAYGLARQAGDPFMLVCLDIMMPEMDGRAALKAIRAAEEAQSLPPSRCAKIVMATALRDLDSVTNAYRELCDGYLVKPMERAKLVALLKELDIPLTNEPR